MCLCLKALILIATFSKALGFPLEFNVSAITRRTTLPLGNAHDMTYTTEITLGGSDQIYTVVLDSGSHEFWVTPLDQKSVLNSKNTGKTAGIGYVGFAAGGTIKTADLTFAGHKIPAQSFFEIPESQVPQNLQTRNIQGIIGLRIDQPSSISDVWQNTAAAYSPLQRLFTQETAVPRIVTMLLGRSNDPTDSSPGFFTVGSVLEEYTKIKDQPKLKTNPEAHFKFLMDDHSVRVEENLISADTTMKTASMADRKKLTAFVDSGFSFNQVPPSVADDIYMGYPDAQKIGTPGDDEVWILPCTEEVRVVFRLSKDSEEIPIHPLDATIDPNQLGMNDIVMNDKKMCIGAASPLSLFLSDQGFIHRFDQFQPIGFQTEEADIILGAAFLRNVYALTNFGEDVKENPKGGYMQFLGRTDSDKASEDFRKVRCGGQCK